MKENSLESSNQKTVSISVHLWLNLLLFFIGGHPVHRWQTFSYIIFGSSIQSMPSIYRAVMFSFTTLCGNSTSREKAP
jgi:hypothetical protein